MKNLSPTLVRLILIVFVCNSQHIIAQVTSKSLFLNGNLSFKDNNSLITVHKKPNNDIIDLTKNQLQLNSSLGVGYTFLNRLIIGGAFNYNFRNEAFGQSGILNNRSYHTFTWGPFGRLYIINKKAGFFTELKYLRGNHTDIDGYNADEIQRGTLSILSYGLGGNYFLTRRLSLELLVSHQKEKRVGELKPNRDPYANSKISSNSKAVQVNFGIAYLINP